MKVKNDYSKCLTNLACSIRKFLGLNALHSTLPEVDQILAKRRPRNVVLILLDGMGANIMRRTLDQDSFFVKNTLFDLSTVFPATTTAATTSMRTGLNPVEHGWLGWNMYFAPIDETITLFMNCKKADDEHICQAYLKKKDLLYQDTTVAELNRVGKVDAEELFPFGDNNYDGLDNMLERILQKANQPGKHFIYAYNNEPDGTMHETGPDSKESRALIGERNEKIERLAASLHDTLLIVVADHGHVKTRPYYLADYPDIMELLSRTTSLEQRAVSFKVLEGKKSEFRRRFNRYFGKDFKLYETSDVIKSGLFGDGEENSLFRPALGDFLAITDSDACLTAPDDEKLISCHGGYHDDEIFVPLILKYCE